jgi:hypothetical protein
LLKRHSYYISIFAYGVTEERKKPKQQCKKLAIAIQYNIIKKREKKQMLPFVPTTIF